MTTFFLYDVFISHSSKDKMIARDLASKLRNDGLRVWFDEWEIIAGDMIGLKVEQGLESSRILILIMSSHALTSDWVNLERQTTLFRDPVNKQRRFIPVRIDNLDIKDILKQYAYIDWRNKSEEQYLKLLEICKLNNTDIRLNVAEYNKLTEITKTANENVYKEKLLDLSFQLMQKNFPIDYKTSIALILEKKINDDKIMYSFIFAGLLSSFLTADFSPSDAFNLANNLKFFKLATLYNKLNEKQQNFRKFYELVERNLNLDIQTSEIFKSKFIEKHIIGFTLSLFERSIDLYNLEAQKVQEIFNEMQIRYNPLLFDFIKYELIQYDIHVGSVNKTKSTFRVRAFKAIDDFDSCIRFFEGHQKILSNHGLTKIFSSTPDWMHSTSTYLVVIESNDGNEMFGGLRIQLANAVSILPIEEAIGKVEPAIHDVVKHFAQNGTGEICGLWNSVNAAGMGISTMFPLRAALAICKQIGVTSLFFLASPASVRFGSLFGARILNEIGNNGTIYYPKLDLLATAFILEDVIELVQAHPRERQKIFGLREKLNFSREEKSPFKDFNMTIDYRLKISSLL